MIQFEGVGLRYGRDDETLRGVDLNLPAASFHFVTGASGAGKSSLLKLLYLETKPSAGRISLFGRDVSTLTRDEIAWFRRRIGVVFQDFRLLDHLTAAENVALPLSVTGAKPEAFRENVVEMMHWVGLGAKIDAYPAQLSGGEKQRIAIARAVVASPDIILADEPTGSVDPGMADRIMKLFLEMNRMGKTIIVASHDLSLIQSYRLPILHLENGTLSPARRPVMEDET